MLQSCETLITKINEWQKAILELEELSDVFLNSGDEKLKSELDKIRQEAKKLTEEYQELAYPELPNGENLFWVESEALKELFGDQVINSPLKNHILIIKDNHAISIKFWYNLVGDVIDPAQNLNFTIFQNLKTLFINSFNFKVFPKVPVSIEIININGNQNIKIPEDLTYLVNLRSFSALGCDLKKLPEFFTAIETLIVRGNFFSDREKQRIRKKYQNATIEI